MAPTRCSISLVLIAGIWHALVHNVTLSTNYLTKSSIGRGDGPGAQQHQTAAAEPADEVLLGILEVAVAADHVIKGLGDDQPLARVRSRAERRPQQGNRLDQGRAECCRAGTEHGRARSGAAAQLGFLDETMGLV